MQSVYDGRKEHCFGCGACADACPGFAIKMTKDREGFYYPVIQEKLCMDCNVCRQVCPYIHMPDKNQEKPFVFGGYHKNHAVRKESTSGGAFSAIAEVYCDKNYVIFGAKANGLNVYHTSISDKKELSGFRKSKYAQSITDGIYRDVENCLKQGKKVLFSGTPCKIAALYNFIGQRVSMENLLTVEVVCEGFPSPLLIQKFCEWLEKKYHSSVQELDYRCKDKNRWDFQVMKITFQNNKIIKKDRWCSPFWIFWSQRFMSRPSCTVCPFRTKERVADITLGDLWGVHKYCPELYGNNGGSSLVVCSSKKGKQVFRNAQKLMFGHSLVYEDALMYQRPMRVIVPADKRRGLFMRDLETMDYRNLCRKWKPRPSFKLLISKYIFGSNQQIVRMWKLRHPYLAYVRKGRSHGGRPHM